VQRPRRVKTDAIPHRQLGVDLYNYAWTLMDTAGRKPEQDDELIHAAHASAHHWRIAGEPVNWARSEWQCSRVYAVLGRAEPALWHGRRCLELCEQHGIGDFDLAYAYEALARAHSLAGESAEAGRLKQLAEEHGRAIAEHDDREHFARDLATIGS
jgi:hypothetical protein